MKRKPSSSVPDAEGEASKPPAPATPSDTPQAEEPAAAEPAVRDYSAIFPDLRPTHRPEPLQPPHRRQRGSPPPPNILQQIDALLATVRQAADYDQQAEQIDALRKAVNQNLAAHAAEAIKAAFLRRDTSTYEAKLAATRWLSGELRRFGLAIHVDKLAGPATLSAERKGAAGRFKLKAKAKPPAGTPSNLNTADAADLLARIRLVEAPPRREVLQRQKAKQPPTSEA